MFPGDRGATKIKFVLEASELPISGCPSKASLSACKIESPRAGATSVNSFRPTTKNRPIFFARTARITATQYGP